MADSEPRSSDASSIDADQHRRSDTPLTPRTAHTSVGSSSASRLLAGPGSDLYEECEAGGKVEVSDVRVPVPFAAGMKLLFKSRAQVSASGVPVRYAVPFASWLDHGYKEQVVFLRELRLSQVRSKHRRAKRKRARSPKPDFQPGL
jgi:hypothetical protein